MSAAIAGMISEPTAKPARNNFLVTDTLLAGNGKHMRLLTASGDLMVTLTEKRGASRRDRQQMATEEPAPGQ
jgi:hypothetical protein